MDSKKKAIEVTVDLVELLQGGEVKANIEVAFYDYLTESEKEKLEEGITDIVIMLGEGARRKLKEVREEDENESY